MLSNSVSHPSARGMLLLSQLPVWTKPFGVGVGWSGSKGVGGPPEAVPAYDCGGLWKAFV